MKPDPHKSLSNAQMKGLEWSRGSHNLPSDAQQAIKRLGRPPVDQPKMKTTLRIDPDVLSAFKQSGAGWQTRINALLREHMPK